MARDTTMFDATRQRDRTLPRKLATNHQITLFDPKEVGVTQVIATSSLFSENSAASVVKTDWCVRLIARTFDWPLNQICDYSDPLTLGTGSLYGI